MNRTCISAVFSSAGLLLAGVAVSIPAAQAHDTGIHDNCTNFNDRFPHGVGTRSARDSTSGTPVTSFKRSKRIYWRAERHNSDLDHDRIACEKA